MSSKSHISIAQALLIGALAIFLFVFVFSQPLQAEELSLRIMAGSGQVQKLDGLLTKAGFNTPYGLAVDSKGSIYVADSYNNTVRVIANGIVGTVAGSENGKDSYGLPMGGYADGAVSEAKFNRPRGIVVDAQGIIYVADTENHVIRKIAGGKVTTLAGTGKAGYKNGIGREAQFDTPSGLAVDKVGNVYVADTLNNVIRKITASGIVSTYAGKGTGEAGFLNGSTTQALFNEPADLAFDNKDNLYILDSGNQLIRLITGGKVETLAGSQGSLIAGTAYYQGSYRNGLIKDATFNFPKGLTVLENGTVIIADTWNYRVRAILPTGKVITLAGTGKSGRTEGNIEQAIIGSPVGIVSYQNNLYLADSDNNVIWQLNINPDALMARPDYDEPTPEVQVWVLGKRLELNQGMKPYLAQDKTMLPLRAIAEALGCTVDWSKDGTITVTRGDLAKAFRAKDTNLQNSNGHTMVGLRYLAENLGCAVDWVPAYRAVSVMGTLGE